MTILDEAQARADARDARPHRQIDYERMNRIFPKQKAALTRAIKRVEAARTSTRDIVFMDEGDLRAAQENLVRVCKKAVTEWNECGAWPDDWARWQRALDDALGWRNNIQLEDL